MPENTSAPTAAPLLELRGISKTFPGVRALQGVRLTANAGRVHALMGENGAGKSTLMTILSGACMPDAGAQILIDGERVNIDGPIAAKNLQPMVLLPSTLVTRANVKDYKGWAAAR